VRRLAPIALVAAALALTAMQCASRPVSVLENATGAPLHVEVVCQDEWTFVGELADVLVIGTAQVVHRLERLGIRRPDGSVQRFDRARLALLAEEIPDADAIAWVIDGESLRAVPFEKWAKGR
jgi:hypothetical protein